MSNLAITVLDHFRATDPLIRRVYDMPVELHGRLINYMAATGVDDENDAIKRLISEELNQYETADQLYARLARMEATEASIAACGHPQVEGFHWSKGRDDISIFMRNGRVLRFNAGVAHTDVSLLVRAL